MNFTHTLHAVNKQQKALINQLSLAFPPSTPSLRFTASYHSTHTDSSGSRPGSRTGHKRISHPQSLVLQRQQLARLYPQSNSALVSSTVSASLPFAPGFYSGHGKAGTGGANANAANTHNIPPASEVLSRRGHRSSCFLLDQTAHTSGSAHETKSNNTKTRRDEEVNIPTNADSVPHSSKEHEMSRDISGTSNISNIESSSPGEGGYQHFTLGDLLREVGLWPPPANLDLPLARPQTSQFDDFFSPPHPSSSASSSTSDATTASSPVIGGGSTTAHSVHLGEGRKGKNDDTTEASIVLAGKGGQDGETRDFRTMPSGPSSGPIPPSSSRQRKKGAEGKSKRKQL